MNKTFLILKHEFLKMVSSKGFIILTLLFPLIGVTAIGINQLLSIIGQSESVDTATIGYIDQTGRFTSYTDRLDGITLVLYQGRDEATRELLNGKINEYFIIPENYLEQGRIVRYHTEKELEMDGKTYATIRTFLQGNLLREETSPEIIERVKYPINMNSIRLDLDGKVASDQGGISAFLVPMVFGILLILAIGSSSGTLLQGLGEEKQNRIMEVLLSTVSTRQLLLGKVLGLGSAGLVQVIFWLATLFLVLQLASRAVGGLFNTLQMPENILILGIAYFILGYLFFAIMQAGLGAIVPNPKDSPQITVAFILPAVLPFYVGILFLRDNPDHIIGTILTFFPVTAPMTVFIRLGLSDISSWELIVSIIILVLSIIGALLLAAKTFRVFLLMYGKSPRLGEILRMIRQA